MNKMNYEKATRIDGEEVASRLKGILKAHGVEMFITGLEARVSAEFPDGSVAYYQPLHLDTREL